jgi:hypothetical protein
MKYLSDLDNSEKSLKLIALKSVTDAYGKWISEVGEKIIDLEEKYYKTAEKNINYNAV